MSEDEVSSLVHSALLRARQATSSFSPRARSARSPLSQSSTSPRGSGETRHGSSYGKRPASATSPRKASSGLYVPRNEDIEGPPSLSKRSHKAMYTSPRSKAGETSVYSFDGLQSPEQSEMENVEVDISAFSMESTNDGEDDTMTDEGDELDPTITSVNSSEAIIRRVEEEIANARKAAQEANRRLAGVSANLKDAKAAADGAAKEAAAAAVANKDSAGAKKTAGESRNPSPSITSPSGEEDGSTQALFDSAMDVIGEEFDIHESKNEIIDIDNSKDSMYDDEHDPSMTRSEEETEATVSSTERGSSLESPDDERFSTSKRPDRLSVDLEVAEDDIPMSPSEEIDSLLRSSSNDILEELSSKASSSVISRRRTIDTTPFGTIEEGPSEEIKTPKAKGKASTPKAFSPKRETLDKKAQKDEADLLAMASIDEASINDEEIRASRDSAFDENIEDDDLLEWLPIGGSKDQLEILSGRDSNKFSESEMPKANEESISSKAMEDDRKDADAADEAPADEIMTDENIVPSTASIEKAPENEKANLSVDEANVDDSESDLKTAGHDSTELGDPVAVAKVGEVDAPGDELDPVTDDVQKTTTSSELPEEDHLSRTKIDQEEKKTKALRNDSTSEDETDAKTPGNSEADDMAIKENSGDVFIYQVVSVGSTDAVATERQPLPLDPSDDDIGSSLRGLETSLSRQEETVIDEAIEVATEPLKYNPEDQDEQVNRMNESWSSESDTDEGSENGEEHFHENEEKTNTEESRVDANGAIEEATSDDTENGTGEEASIGSTVEDGSSVDDHQVTQIMGNTDFDSADRKNCEEQASQPMNNMSEEHSEATENEDSPDEAEKSESTTTLLKSSTQPPPSPIVSPIQVQVPAPAPTLPAPSPRQLALIENRRAAQSQVDEARNAMCGESGVPTGLPNPEKEIVHRVKKVKFKQRYPVPPPARRPLKAAEIVFNNQTPAPKDRLHLSRPKKDLKELLEAAIGNSIQRRSNAFGALKVLSTQKKNKMALVRTKGFLDSTVFAINDNISSFEDSEAATASRTRAVNVVLNVSEMKDNRFHVLTHPGLANCLVKCMVEDKGEARALACSVLATLAKSPACREPMSHTNKLLDTLAIILKGDEPFSFSHKEQNFIQEEKKDYSGDDEASRNVFSNSYSSGSSGSHSSLGSSHNNEARNRARLSACAALIHLSKECSVAQRMCSSTTVLYCLVATCNETDNPLHTKCLEILASLSRFPHNNSVLTTYPGLVDSLIENGNHKNDIDRLWSMRTMQNLSSDPSSKIILATGTVLELLSVNIMRQQYDEQLAAIAALYNISTEPGAVVPLTNTKNVVATLVHVAHNPTSPSDVRLMACDTLATLGLWLQTLAGAGTVPADIEPVPLPTYITSGWKRWEK
jgi:hypothetical protein